MMLSRLSGKIGYELHFSGNKTHINHPRRDQQANSMVFKRAFCFVSLLWAAELCWCFLAVQWRICSQVTGRDALVLCPSRAQGFSPGSFAQAEGLSQHPCQLWGGVGAFGLNQ